MPLAHSPDVLGCQAERNFGRLLTHLIGIWVLQRGIGSRCEYNETAAVLTSSVATVEGGPRGSCTCGPLAATVSSQVVFGCYWRFA